MKPQGIEDRIAADMKARLLRICLLEIGIRNTDRRGRVEFAARLLDMAALLLFVWLAFRIFSGVKPTSLDQLIVLAGIAAAATTKFGRLWEKAAHRAKVQKMAYDTLADFEVADHESHEELDALSKRLRAIRLEDTVDPEYRKKASYRAANLSMGLSADGSPGASSVAAS